MNAQKYPHKLLTVIAVLLLLNVFAYLLPSTTGTLFGLANAADASAQNLSEDIVVSPVGNQDVHFLVIFDRKSKTIYSYDDDGELKNTWVVGKLGEDLQKKK